MIMISQHINDNWAYEYIKILPNVEAHKYRHMTVCDKRNLSACGCS